MGMADAPTTANSAPPAINLPLDEASRRCDDFIGGIGVVLPDGDEWWFAQPVAQNKGGGGVAATLATSRHPSLAIPLGDVSWSFGDGVPADVNAVLSAKFAAIVRKYLRATDDSQRACAALEACWFLLARNYAITPDEFGGLVGRAAALGDDRQRDLADALRAVVVVAIGRAILLAEVV